MKKILFTSLLVTISLGVLSVLTGVGVLVYFSFDLPKISTLADYKPPITSQILSKDGIVLADFALEKREVVAFDQIPQVIIDAFLAAEDDRFYEHKGVDYIGIMRALLADIKAGKIVQGGSTITQQVAKSLLLTNKRSVIRKIKDFLLAQRIEEKFSKQEILYLYLNQVYLGGGHYGIKNAFAGYFNKELIEATIAESSMIAGLLVAPGRYSPYINPEYAKKRQRYVLNRMLATNKITRSQYQEALDTKLQYRIRKKSVFQAGYFTDWIRQKVIDLVGKDRFLTEGFKVVTTLDWEMQKHAEKLVYNGAKEIDKRQGYKGPLSHLNNDEEITNFEIEFRKAMYREKSLYFTIDENLSRSYELEFNEEKFNELQEYKKEWMTEIKNKRFRPGIYKKDTFFEHIEKEKNYKAVVIKVDDWARVAYVSIGGIIGIIPYEFYRWAHERNISSKKNYYSYVQRPSSILKRGDVVLVRIERLKTSIGRHLNKNFREKFKTKDVYKKLKEERYLLCMLDQEPDVQAALITIHPKTGEVISLVGGTNFSKTQFNRAIQSKRQPGSSFKPILYAAGLENGYTPASILIDSPESLGGVGDGLNWKPANYDGKFKGPMTFRNSLEKSRNVPTIKLAAELGVGTILDFVDRIGLNAELEHDLSLSLGSFGVTLMDIVATYAIFPNGGKLVNQKSIISITDRDGNMYNINDKNIKQQNSPESRLGELDEGTQKLAINELMQPKQNSVMEEEAVQKEINPYHVALGGSQVYDPRLAYLMTNLLKGVVHHGTGRRALDVSHFLGGKTGTTNNYVDAWFIGFSSNLVTGVWTGLDDNKTLGWGETGAKAALPIWKEFMRQGLKKYGEYDFSIPAGIINVLIDKITGKLATEEIHGAFTESFIEDTKPGTMSTEEISSKYEQDGNVTVLLEEDDYYENQ